VIRAASSSLGGVRVGSEVSFNASSSSDPEGDGLSFSWSLSQPLGGTANLQNPQGANASLIPTVPGEHAVVVTVSDGDLTSTETFTFSAVENRLPIAVTDAAYEAFVGAPIALSGSASSDPDNDPLSFTWTLVSTPEGSSPNFTGTDSSNPIFTPDRIGSFQLLLTVSDGFGADDVLTSITVLNRAPQSVAGSDQSVAYPNEVCLDGSGSFDPDNQVLNYLWEFASFPGGSAPSLSSDSVFNPCFDANLEGAYELNLTVADPLGASDTSSVIVSSQNVAPAHSTAATC